MTARDRSWAWYRKALGSNPALFPRRTRRASSLCYSAEWMKPSPDRERKWREIAERRALSRGRVAGAEGAWDEEGGAYRPPEDHRTKLQKAGKEVSLKSSTSAQAMATMPRCRCGGRVWGEQALSAASRHNGGARNASPFLSLLTPAMKQGGKKDPGRARVRQGPCIVRSHSDA